MPPSDALAMKAEFRQELGGGMYRQFMDHMLPEMQRPDVGKPLISPYVTTDTVLRDMQAWTQASETYYVSPDMMRLAVGSMGQLPDDVTIDEHLPPSPQGFLWLATPLRVYDLRGRILPINAVLWSVFGGGVMVWLLTDKYEPLNQALQVAQGISTAHIPRLTPWHAAVFRFGEPLPEALSLVGQKPIPPEVKVSVHQDPATGSITWAVGDNGLDIEEMRPVMQVAQEALFLTVVWRLMRQTIVAVSREEVDKRARRLALKHLRAERHVSVIALRRTESRYHDDPARTWTLDHRVLVRGHWRRQWYGSGEDRHQDWVYIHPFVKGPDDKPFVLTDKVQALIR